MSCRTEMKLTQLQEARHHTDHPIIAWIKNFVEKSEVEGDSGALHSSTYRFLSDKQGHEAADAITREFGKQITVKDWPVTEWNIDRSDDMVVHLQIDYKEKEVLVRRMRWNW